MFVKYRITWINRNDAREAEELNRPYREYMEMCLIEVENHSDQEDEANACEIFLAGLNDDDVQDVMILEARKM